MRIKCFSIWLQRCVFAALLSVSNVSWSQEGTPEAVVPEGVPEPNTLTGRPKWEVGVGGGFFQGFDYPGSLDSNQRSFGLPFFIYRSKRFRFGGGGLSAVTIERPRFKLDWSVAASLNASTQEGSVRDGLEELDFLFELGPKLVVRAVDTIFADDTQLRIDWSTKLRGVVSTDFGSVAGQGFVFESTVAGQLRNFFGQRRVALFGALGTRAGTEQLNDYFYEVAEEFVTPTRAAFDARGGLIDITAAVGVGLRLPYRVRVFVAASTGFFAASANRDSPLHEAVSTTSLALGLVWTIWQSKERVGVLEVDSR